MLLGNNEKLAEATVKVLGRNPHLNVTELYALLQQQHYTGSIKGVYKALKQLEEGGIALRVNRKYSLKLSWVSQMLTLLESIYDKTVKSLGYDDLLVGSKRHWRFNNLTRFNAFWTQVMLFLLTRSQRKILYDWVPHPWFYLIQPKVEGQFLNTLERLKVRTLRVVGGDRYLDRLPSAYWKQTTGKTVFCPEAFGSEHSKYYVVIDDFVLTTGLDAKTAARIETLYHTVDSANKMDPPLINQALDSPALIKFKIELNAKFAGKIKGKIENLLLHQKNSVQ